MCLRFWWRAAKHRYARGARDGQLAARTPRARERLARGRARARARRERARHQPQDRLQRQAEETQEGRRCTRKRRHRPPAEGRRTIGRGNDQVACRDELRRASPRREDSQVLRDNGNSLGAMPGAIRVRAVVALVANSPMDIDVGRRCEYIIPSARVHDPDEQRKDPRAQHGRGPSLAVPHSIHAWCQRQYDLDSVAGW